MKNFITITLAAMFLVAVVVSVSMAGYGYHGYCSGMGISEMSKLDGDTDKKLTFDEFSAPQMDRLKSAFNMLDTDKDGVISEAEYNEFLKVHGYGDRSEG